MPCIGLLFKDSFPAIEAQRDRIGLIGSTGCWRVRRQEARSGDQGMRCIRSRITPGCQQMVLTYGGFQRLDGMEPCILAQECLAERGNQARRVRSSNASSMLSGWAPATSVAVGWGTFVAGIFRKRFR